MIIDILKDAIRTNIGPLKTAPKGWFKTCCRLCHTRGQGKDTRNRFGIQFNANSICCNCFNCGFSASYTSGEELSRSFKILLTNLHIDNKFIQYVEFQIFTQKHNIQSLRDGAPTQQVDQETKFRNLFNKWQPKDLPRDTLSVTQWLENGLDDPEFMKVVDYALARKLYNLDNFYWSPSKLHNVNQRLIIPYYYRDKIVGFTARLCYDMPDKSIPKYYQQCPQDFVYNLDNQDDWSRKYVIVTEGVLDAWCIDGVSVLGEIGQEKVDIINRLQKEVIVCPDRDKKGYDLVDVSIENGWAVAFPKWDNDIKDAAKASEKYGRLLTTHSVISSAVTGSVKIKVAWDLEQNRRNHTIKRSY